MMQMNQVDNASNQMYSFGLAIFHSGDILFPNMIGVDRGVLYYRKEYLDCSD